MRFGALLVLLCLVMVLAFDRSITRVLGGAVLIHDNNGDPDLYVAR